MGYKLLLSVLFALMLFSITTADTVTLTGSCLTQNVVNQSNNHIDFGISNSGNGTATNLVLVPAIGGASSLNTTQTIPLIGPGGSYVVKFYLNNFTVPGSYADYFLTRYSQGSSTFVTFFPCMVNMQRVAPSLLTISNLSKSGNRLSVKLVNLARYPIRASLHIQTPPTFSLSNSDVNITVPAYAQINLSTNLTTPQYTNAVFPLAASVSYTNGSTHYATLQVTTISFGSTGSTSPTAPSSSVDTVSIIIIVAILILLLLIVVSLIKRRKPIKPREQPAAPTEHATQQKTEQKA